MAHILAAVDGPVAVVDVVEREAQYVFRGGDGEDAKERESIDLQPSVAQGALTVIGSTDEEELLTYIDLAQELGAGEAMTAALAIHRGYTVVTDDRKAARVLAGQTVTLRTTLDLVRAWADHQAVSAEVLRVVLTDLRERGNYYPARSHPLRSWWDTALGLA
jgi:predicted nucleic acid-binding protein